MTYPASPPPYGYTPPPGYPPPPDSSGKFLKLSGAALIWTVIGVIAVCIGGPVAVCLLCGFSGLFAGVTGGGDPSATPF